jgi:hypothetical protein
MLIEWRPAAFLSTVQASTSFDVAKLSLNRFRAKMRAGHRRPLIAIGESRACRPPCRNRTAN